MILVSSSWAQVGRRSHGQDDGKGERGLGREALATAAVRYTRRPEGPFLPNCTCTLYWSLGEGVSALSRGLTAQQASWGCTSSVTEEA